MSHKCKRTRCGAYFDFENGSGYDQDYCSAYCERQDEVERLRQVIKGKDEQIERLLDAIVAHMDCEYCRGWRGCEGGPEACRAIWFAYSIDGAKK